MKQQQKFRAALLVLFLVYFALVAVLIFLRGTPFENTLTLSAAGQIDFNAAWFYRFRNPAFLTHASAWNISLPVFFFIVKYAGARVFWMLTLCLQAAILVDAPLALKLLSLPLAAAGFFLGETALLWSTAFLLVVKLFLVRRGSMKTRLATAFAAVFFILLGIALAHPLDHFRRQTVLGGRSVADTLKAYTGDRKPEIRENCVAAINPDDLRAVNSVELIGSRSFRGFSEIKMIDLKVAEANYRFLSMRDEKGKFIFSAKARDFAAAEAAYAEPVVANLLKTPALCLIANFDGLPQNETAPFSRARRILDLRKKAGLETKVIQLSHR